MHCFTEALSRINQVFTLLLTDLAAIFFMSLVGFFFSAHLPVIVSVHAANKHFIYNPM